MIEKSPPLASEFAREVWKKMVAFNGKLVERNTLLRVRAEVAETRLTEIEKEVVAFLATGFDIESFQRQCYTPIELLNATLGKFSVMSQRLAAYEIAASGQLPKANAKKEGEA